MSNDVDDEPSAGGASTPVPTTVMASVPMDKLAKAYRKMAAKLQELQAAFDAEAERIKEQQTVVANALKDQMMVLGVTSVRTTEGTVILGTKTRYNISDWDAFKDFVIQEEAVDLLEKRVAQGNMGKWLEANPGKLPPSLNVFSEHTISVRKPTATGDVPKVAE